MTDNGIKRLNLYFFPDIQYKKNLFKLLIQLYSAGEKTLLICGSEDKVEEYDKILWEYEQLSFLPHGRIGDEYSKSHPLLLLSDISQLNMMLFTDIAYILVILVNNITDSFAFPPISLKYLFKKIMIVIPIADKDYSSQDILRSNILHNAKVNLKNYCIDLQLSDLSIVYYDVKSKRWSENIIQINEICQYIHIYYIVVVLIIVRLYLMMTDSACHKNKIKSISYLLWLLVTFFYGYQYIFRIMPSIIMDDVIRRFGVTTEHFGYFSAIYYIGVAAIHIPMGVLIDRFGAKLVMSTSLFIIAISSLPLAYLDSWMLVILSRAVIGAASVASVIGAFKLMRIAFGEDRFGSMLGLMVTFGLLAAAYGGKPISYFIAQHGFEAFVDLLVILGLILGFITYIVTPSDAKLRKIFSITSSKNLSEIEYISSGKKRNNMWSDALHVMSNYKIILISSIGGLMIGPLEGFADAWLAVFLKNVYNLEAAVASTGTTSFFLGVCIGFPFIGYILEKSHAHYTIIVLCALGMLLCLFALDFELFNYWVRFNGYQFNLVTLILFILGALGGYQVAILTLVVGMVNIRFFGVATAVCNMIMMVFGSFFHSIIGKYVTYYSNLGMGTGNQVEEVALTYTRDAMIKGTAVIPISMFVALIIISFFGARERCFKQKEGK